MIEYDLNGGFNMKAIWIRRIYHILLTAALIAAGLCLIGGALQIFYSGGAQIYTLEKIRSTFRTVSAVVYIALALVVGSFILELVLPAPKKRKPEKNFGLILKGLQQRANLDKCGDKNLCRTILRLRRKRMVMTVISTVLLGLCFAVFMVYAFVAGCYPTLTESAKDPGVLNRGMLQNTVVWAICMAIPFIFGVIAAYMTRAGMKTEITLLRQVAMGKKPPEVPARDRSLRLSILRGAILCVAATLLVLGTLGDGWKDVLGKAVKICTECIGLG